MGLLGQAGGKGRVVAGGTDLIPKLRKRVYTCDLLVDVTGIEELGRVWEEDGFIHIGAAVTHGEVGRNALVLAGGHGLAEGCRRVGSPQVRNMGTLMGNVINAQPATDGAIPLAALEGEIRVVSKAGERWVPVVEAYRGLGVSSIDPSAEIASEIRFRKLGTAHRSGFFRISRRKALTLPVLNGAVVILLDPSTKGIREARIALGPVAEKPLRAMAAETFLKSKEISPEVFFEAARMASEESRPRTSRLRGTSAYRKEMVRVFLERTLLGLMG
jgi:CO/xanthine dehydrogenase FAD-binding subunit